MNNPRINILLPTYEPRAEHLRAALDSLLAQTEQDWTLFIHDDASRKDVLHMLAPYMDDERITFKRSEERLGIGKNWNACLREGSAPLIQFLFQDDQWEPTYLENALEIFEEHPSVGFASMNHQYQYEGEIESAPLYEKLVRFKSQQIHPGIHDGKGLLRWWVGHGLQPNIIGEPPFVMLRRTVAEEVGLFREDMPQSLDVEYWTRLLAKTNWYYEPTSLGSFRVHADAASARNFGEGLGVFDRFRCLENLQRILPPEEMPFVKKAIAQNLDSMVAKYFQRKKDGKSVKMQGSGSVFRFCLRHPVLVMRSLFKGFMKRKSNT